MDAGLLRGTAMTWPGHSLKSQWERFWFAEVSPHIYAVLRIALGLVGTLVLVRLADPTFWDATSGLMPDATFGTFKALLRARGMGPLVGWGLYGFCLASFVAMTVGLNSALTVPLALVAQLLQQAWNPLPLSGAHSALQSMLFCLMWADTGSVWSFDAWLARRRGAVGASRLTSIAPLRLLRFQIALIYFSTGLWKLSDPAWRDGSAVHYALSSNIFHRFPQQLPPSFDWLTVSATYLTLGWELGFAFLLLWRPTRILAIALGIAMHLGMLAALEIGPFHFVMMTSYLAFLDPGLVAKRQNFHS